MEKVDILLATYNGEKYIREQIDSILNQTYKEFRLLISDDGSTDGTRDILNEYKAKDDRIEIFMQEENLGVVKNAKRRPVDEVEAIFSKLETTFDLEGAVKEDVVEVLKEYLPNFSHISKGKSLDGRM